MRKCKLSVVIATALASTITLASVASAQTTTTGGSTGSSGTSRTTAQGVTSDTIHVAMPYIDFAKLKDVGVSIDRGDPTKIVPALVDGINARGGINGRKLQVDLVKYDLLNPASIDAACVQMTDDLQAFAVVGGFPGIGSTGNQCITDHKVALVAEGAGADAQAVASAQKPVLSSDVTNARSYKVFAQLLAKKGIFKGKTVGIVTPATEAENTKKILVPALKKVGVTPKLVLVDDVTAGDTAAEDANWDVYAEKIKAEGVNHLILVGGQAAGGTSRVVDHALDVTLSSPNPDIVASVGRSQTQHPPSAYNGIVTIGALTDDQKFEQPTTKQCIADFKKAFPDVTVKAPSEVPEGQPDYASGIASPCTALTMFVLAAGKAGKDLDNASLWKGATTGLTQNFALPTSPYNTWGPKKPDANNGFQLAVFDASIGKAGGLKPQGTLVNLGA